MTHAQWIDRFAMRMSRLQAGTPPEQIVALAEQTYLVYFMLAPEQAAVLEAEEPAALDD